MNISPSLQKLVLSLVIIAGLGYVAFSTITAEIPVGEEGVLVAPPKGQDILILADKLEDVNIDKTFFSSYLFTSLVDITVPIIEESAGRANPFLPIGTEDVSEISSRKLP